MPFTTLAPWRDIRISFLNYAFILFVCLFLTYYFEIIIDPQEVTKIFHSLFIFHSAFLNGDNIYNSTTTSKPRNWCRFNNVNEIIEQLFNYHRVLHIVILVICLCVSLFSALLRLLTLNLVSDTIFLITHLNLSCY